MPVNSQLVIRVFVSGAVAALLMVPLVALWLLLTVTVQADGHCYDARSGTSFLHLSAGSTDEAADREQVKVIQASGTAHCLAGITAMESLLNPHSRDPVNLDADRTLGPRPYIRWEKPTYDGMTVIAPFFSELGVIGALLAVTSVLVLMLPSKPGEEV